MLSQSARRHLRAFTVVLLLLWQGAATAQACAHVAASAGGCTISQPCHVPGAQDQASGHAPHHAHSMAQHVSTGTAKPGVVAAADLPALTADLDPPVARGGPLLLAALPAPRAESPPLIILHRRLRN